MNIQIKKSFIEAKTIDDMNLWKMFLNEKSKNKNTLILYFHITNKRSNQKSRNILFTENTDCKKGNENIYDIYFNTLISFHERGIKIDDNHFIDLDLFRYLFTKSFCEFFQIEKKIDRYDKIYIVFLFPSGITEGKYEKTDSLDYIKLKEENLETLFSIVANEFYHMNLLDFDACPKEINVSMIYVEKTKKKKLEKTVYDIFQLEISNKKKKKTSKKKKKYKNNDIKF